MGDLHQMRPAARAPDDFDYDYARAELARLDDELRGPPRPPRGPWFEAVLIAAILIAGAMVSSAAWFDGRDLRLPSLPSASPQASAAPPGATEPAGLGGGPAPQVPEPSPEEVPGPAPVEPQPEPAAEPNPAPDGVATTPAEEAESPTQPAPAQPSPSPTVSDATTMSAEPSPSPGNRSPVRDLLCDHLVTCKSD